MAAATAAKPSTAIPPTVAPTARPPTVRLSDRPLVLEGAAATAADTYTFYDHVTRRVVTVRRDMDIRVISLDGSPDVALKSACARSGRKARTTLAHPSGVGRGAAATWSNQTRVAAETDAAGSAIAGPCWARPSPWTARSWACNARHSRWCVRVGAAAVPPASCGRSHAARCFQLRGGAAQGRRSLSG